jgi:tetratricopeptide (TPR) repeat protein/TolB-like protein
LLFLSDALPNVIANRIGAAVPRIYVVGRRVQRRRPPTNPGEVRALGTELATRYVLAGNLFGARDETRIVLWLFNTGTGKQVWQRTFIYDSTGILPLEQAAAIEVASHIVGAITTTEAQRLRRVPTARHAAYEWALRGDAETEDASRASDAYRRAVQLDRGFAGGYARLALSDAMLLETGEIPREKMSVLRKELPTAAERAVSLDTGSSMAWLAAARSRMLGGQASAVWTDAFERALAVDPTNPAALREYGRTLAQAGDRARAIAILQRAASADPGNAEVLMALGEIAMTDHRDADACALLNRAIVQDALLAPAWALRALVRARNDDLRFAWADAETAERLGNVFLGESAAALVDLAARDTARARERLQAVWEQVRERGSVGVREGRAIAVALLASQQPKRALDVLEAVRALGPWYAATLRDRTFDSVRNEPRFRALASAQVGS